MKNLVNALVKKGFKEKESHMKGLYFFRKGNVRISLDNETIYVKIVASVGYKEVLKRLYNPFEFHKAMKDLESLGIN